MCKLYGIYAAKIMMSNDTIIAQADLLEKLRAQLRTEGRRCRKVQNVLARRAGSGEIIHTFTADGHETSNEAKEGDYIVKNQTEAGEEYIVGPEHFEKKYAQIGPPDHEGWAEYCSQGRIVAVELTPQYLRQLGLPSEFRFSTAWHEVMVAKQGDFLASPPELTEVYRIARKEFFETYEME
jgi:hypothetical protein